MRHIAAALLTLLLDTGASAQAVYRCGNTYTQSPCPQGRLVDATDSRTAAQLAEAKRVAADEKQLTADMRRERLDEEARHKPAGATSLSGAPPKPGKPAAAKKRDRPKKKRAAATPPVNAGGGAMPSRP